MASKTSYGFTAIGSGIQESVIMLLPELGCLLKLKIFHLHRTGNREQSCLSVSSISEVQLSSFWNVVSL